MHNAVTLLSIKSVNTAKSFFLVRVQIKRNNEKIVNNPPNVLHNTVTKKLPYTRDSLQQG